MPQDPSKPGLNAPCANHPARPAELCCARCGTFICGGCVVSGDLCTDCKRRLLKQGIPYSPMEKARAAARKALRLGTVLLRIQLSFGAMAALLLLLAGAGAGPEWFDLSGRLLTLPCIGAGLFAAGAGAFGWRHSERGRPSSAVLPIVPTSSAAALIVLGLLPAALALLGLLLR